MKGLQKFIFLLIPKKNFTKYLPFTIFWSSGSQSETFFFSTIGIIWQYLKTFLVVTAEGKGATGIYWHPLMHGITPPAMLASSASYLASFIYSLNIYLQTV